jgi:hypothetical protein
VIVNAFWATVSVTAVVVADPHPFVNTARYWFSLCATVGFVSVKVVAVAPGTFEKLPPPLVLTCH